MTSFITDSWPIVFDNSRNSIFWDTRYLFFELIVLSICKNYLHIVSHLLYWTKWSTVPQIHINMILFCYVPSSIVHVALLIWIKYFYLILNVAGHMYSVLNIEYIGVWMVYLFVCHSTNIFLIIILSLLKHRMFIL